MKFSEFFTSKDNIQLDKKTLVILRWIALVGQYLTISVVYFVFEFKLHFFLDHKAILINRAVSFLPLFASFSFSPKAFRKIFFVSIPLISPL